MQKLSFFNKGNDYYQTLNALVFCQGWDRQTNYELFTSTCWSWACIVL